MEQYYSQLWLNIIISKIFLGKDMMLKLYNYINHLIHLLNRISLINKSGFIKIRQCGFYWNIDINSCISKSIAYYGVWEKNTTQLILDYVKPNMKVMDIGANFGYYTLLMARAVQPNGIVYAFEPVEKFRNELKWHVEANDLQKNVIILPFGLSDKKEQIEISISDSSASIHPDPNELFTCNKITVHDLDSVIKEFNIDQIDFIKIDIDGHEPLFLKGAYQSLQRFHPPMSMEFAQHHLHFAGSDVREQKKLLEDLGYSICKETTREKYSSDLEFLMDCGNFDHSCNVLVKL